MPAPWQVPLVYSVDEQDPQETTPTPLKEAKRWDMCVRVWGGGGGGKYVEDRTGIGGHGGGQCVVKNSSSHYTTPLRPFYVPGQLSASHSP